MSNFDLKQPCPRCKSQNVELTSSRSLNVVTSYIQCEDCDLITFNTESILGMNETAILDNESICIKYNAWLETNPKQYDEEFWE